MSPRPIPQSAVDLIRKFEGCRLDAYPDPGTGGEPWTIGYGHTGGVWQGMSISSADAERLLNLDLAKMVARLDLMLTGCTQELNDNQYAALLSFVFNVGPGNFQHSTLRDKVLAAEWEAAGDEFLKWDHAAGHLVEGLERRREAERALFLSPVQGVRA